MHAPPTDRHVAVLLLTLDTLPSRQYPNLAVEDLAQNLPTSPVTAETPLQTWVLRLVPDDYSRQLPSANPYLAPVDIEDEHGCSDRPNVRARQRTTKHSLFY
jgi:hypothetical protein